MQKEREKTLASIREQEKEGIKKQMRDYINTVTPKHLYEYLNMHVIGQDAAKRQVAVAVYNHYKRFVDNIYGYSQTLDDNTFKDVTIEKSNLLMLGPTGTGKTYMLRTLAKYLNIPFYIADCTTMTAAGYVGDDVENAVLGALRAADFNITSTEHAIIVLDEIDKVSRKGDNMSISRDVGGESVQQSLLKLVEGCVVNVPPNGGRKHPEQECIPVNTNNILFVGLGAFDGIEKIIERRKNKKSVGFNVDGKKTTKNGKEEDVVSYVTTEDLRKYGLIPELIGRFPIITNTQHLSEDDLVRILTEPQNSIIRQYQKMFWLDNIDISFSKDALKLIAHTSNERKTGARGLRGIIEKTLNEAMFEHGGYHSKKMKLKITKKEIEKNL